MSRLAEIVERIDQRLEAQGLSARAASLQAGLSADAIRNWKRCVHNEDKSCTLRALEALAPVLGTTVEWLLNGTRTLTIEVRGGLIERMTAPAPIRDLRIVVIDRDTDTMGEDEPLSIVNGDADDLALVTVYDDGPDELAPTPTWEAADVQAA